MRAPHHELHCNKTLAATRLFPRQAILHSNYCIHLCHLATVGVFIQGNGQGNFLRSLCAAPATSQDLRGTLFSTGCPHHLEAMVLKTSWVLHIHHSNKLFSPWRSHSGTRLPIYFHAKLFRHSFLLFCRFPIQDFDASTPLLCPWTTLGASTRG